MRCLFPSAGPEGIARERLGNPEMVAEVARPDSQEIMPLVGTQGDAQVGGLHVVLGPDQEFTHGFRA